MNRIQQAKARLEKAYQEVEETDAVSEAIEIVSKYATVDGKAILDFAIDDIQADFLKLASINMFVNSLWAEAVYQATQSTNKRRWHHSTNWSQNKQNQKGPKGAPISDKYCDAITEQSIYAYREDEAAKQRKAMLLQSAVNSVQEVINALKKVGDRLVAQGPLNNL